MVSGGNKILFILSDNQSGQIMASYMKKTNVIHENF